jgi:ATP-binding cassette, subfamily B (MDR/TAP), member 1
VGEKAKDTENEGKAGDG